MGTGTGLGHQTSLWAPITYKITYILNDGSEANNPTSYNTEDDITLKNPTRAGYSFAGWSGTGIDDKAVSVKSGKVALVIGNTQLIGRRI